jgi:hypothetical protein
VRVGEQITPHEVLNVSKQCKVSSAVTKKLLSFLEERDEVPTWEHILVMATTLLTSNVIEILHLIFELFGTLSSTTQNDEAMIFIIECKYFLDLFHYLVAHYDGINEKIGTKISEYLLSKRFFHKNICLNFSSLMK